MKTGLLFAGQGAQFVGMGEDLISDYAIVNEVFSSANKQVGYDLIEICLTDTQDKLNNTLYTQPAMLTFNHAIFSLLKENNIQFESVAGLSLGEYNAIVAAGVISFEDALEIVSKRAKIMSEALPKGTTKMAAVLKADINIVDDILKNPKLNNEVAICNYNTNDQIVIGGTLEKLQDAVTLLKDAGVKRVIELDVSLVSHMHLLKDASAELRDVLANYSFSQPNYKFINNIAAEYQDDNFVDTLALQISESTHMAQSIELMLNDGITRFIEIGPKASLSSFVKSIAKNLNKEVEILNISNSETFKKVLDEVK